jgi:D-3-phosphoglycerate dehydrogenase
MTLRSRTGTAEPDPATTPLLLDFLDWLAPGPRPYAEVMEAWRTSCPRLMIWEEAVELGLVARRRDEAGPAMVELTPAGRQTRLTRAG